MNSEFQSKLREDISLSGLTTTGLGGRAAYFVSCVSCDDIRSSLKFAEKNKLRVQVISGGSNIIFPDDGFDGLVLKIDMKGIEFSDEGNFTNAFVKAGESWDEFVLKCIGRGLSGIECLSGIPGSAGATPVQNVGAYGQEVKDSIVSLKAIDRSSLKEIIFENKDCNFGYRQSRFKNQDKDKYVITEVRFRLEKKRVPVIKYSELQKLIDSKYSLSSDIALKDKLKIIRNSVFELRKGKSMIIDRKDPNSRSCGSFFINPVLNENEFEQFKLRSGKKSEEIPVFKSGNEHKISAAWLVEQAGFHKGYIKGGAGISQNHSLALINIKGTTKELLDLAEVIEKSVFDTFGIKLRKEPVIV
ncbi:MAG: UDP-N-acetylmuramate dehydrogenase [Ignavibacteria bacterium]|nr:UDP-N-acetylmuramate dehydrogenase [Ignavibacteria bacterium]